MTRAKLTLLLAGAAAAASLGVWAALAVRGDTPGATWNSADQVLAGQSVPPRPTDSSWPLLAGGGAKPNAMGGVAPSGRPPGPRPHASAAPFVQDFAAQPGAKPMKPRKSPTARVSVTPNVDGCDHNYGTKTQCVPLTFPAGTADKCRWLHDHGFTAIKVAGTDRQKLDTDQNGIACDEKAPPG